MNFSRLTILVVVSLALIGCKAGDVDVNTSTDTVTWTGGGDGYSFSDPANWSGPIETATEIRISEAGVAIANDVTIAATTSLSITDGQLVVARGRTLTNFGKIDLQASNIVTQQGADFQNAGGLSGVGVLSLTCDGTVSGIVDDGITVDQPACVDDCTVESFDYPAGTMVTETINGMTVTAVNNNAAHTPAAIVFDSANPTGDDEDLRTPGSGSGNMTALGGLLIIAEDVIDADADGLVDCPDDEAAGGTITFTADCGTTNFAGITLIDIEEGGALIELYDGATLVHTSAIAQLDDNSVQRVDLSGTPPATDLVVYLPSSGAVDDLRTCATQ